MKNKNIKNELETLKTSNTDTAKEIKEFNAYMEEITERQKLINAQIKRFENWKPSTILDK